MLKKMWNHTSVSNTTGRPSSRDNAITKPEVDDVTGKSIDLKLYLGYLDNLFNEPSSESESSDSETDSKLKTRSSSLGNQNSVEATPQLLPKYNFPITSRSTSMNSSQSCLARQTALTSSSSSDTSSDDDMSSKFGLKGLPMSDYNLQELLKVHKAWKKSPYPLGSHEDITSLLNAMNSKNSSMDDTAVTVQVAHPQRRTADIITARNNDTRLKSRKVKLNTAKTEEQFTQNSVISSEDINGKFGDEMTLAKQPSSPDTFSFGSVQGGHLPSTDLAKSVNSLSQSECNAKQEEHPGNPITAITNGNANEVAGTEGLVLTNILEEDDESDSMDDDNDSLSDYSSIAAAAQKGGGQLIQDSITELVDSNTLGNPSLSGSSSKPRNGLDAGENCIQRKTGDKVNSVKMKRTLAQKQAKLIEAFNIKRRKIYVFLCKKEIGKTQRARTNNHKENLAVKRRLAQACSRCIRQKAISSQKVMKESVWRAKRLTREMIAYWKQADRVEREVRKRREKEAEEQRKLDVELMEAKRQQRKLNFLITQTELYAHFISKKLGGETDREEEILNNLEEEKVVSSNWIDGYDSGLMKAKARSNVVNACTAQSKQLKCFSLGKEGEELHQDAAKEFEQPKMFEGVLKHYQLKGMNWLINLYNQGINGILADEMGLGKTVQSMAFLAHVAETLGVWGPFLVIAPASTLHNWQQELKRFVPRLKVVPYWGNPQERKILRQVWQQSHAHNEESSFHIVITSYQIVVTDFKYFNRLKWQYVILDEAQAIKSTTSARWKVLLGFSCRNRLLLTGTPIQNSMAELWALLHFIMPSLFDSHEEFSEWFSKDIESHAENRSSIDERHLSRLHLILKPFMLRRIKKDVENELSDKIEVMVHCPLTSRQKLLYTILKKRIRIEDLLKSSGTSNLQLAQHAATNLMNLVMQFRKVCNHPDLFERRGIQSPYFFPKIHLSLPKLLFDDMLADEMALSSKAHIMRNLLCVFQPFEVHSALNSSNTSCDFLFFNNIQCEWSFTRFLNLSPADIQKAFTGCISQRFQQLETLFSRYYILSRQRLFSDESEVEEIRTRTKGKTTFDFLLEPDNCLCYANVRFSPVLRDLVFVDPASTMYKIGSNFMYRSTFPEEVSQTSDTGKFDDESLIDARRNLVLVNQFCRINAPPFLHNFSPKLRAAGIELCVSDLRLCRKMQEIEHYRKQMLWHLPAAQYFHFRSSKPKGLISLHPMHGWSGLVVPDRKKLVSDSGKLTVLDNLLKKLKANGHRVLIYSQMTKMIDILEEYMLHRKWTYMRLDGSSKISDRRDMVADFQSRSDIFIFLLSTRAGGLGINLTAADTVIFYDSDWNPTVDQQAMDRAHRLGQTKQVHVYRLICKGTIEERILKRAREKNEIQKMVISGGNFRPDALKPKEVVSLLLDDEEMERKYRQRQKERWEVEDFKGTEQSSTEPRNTSRRKFPKGNIATEKSSSISLHSDGLPSISTFKTGDSLGESAASSPSEVFYDAVTGDLEVGADACNEDDQHSSSDSYFEEMDTSVALSPSLMEGFRTVSWTNDPETDSDGEFRAAHKRPKLSRGTGKRGRPPSRIRVHRAPTDGGENAVRRGPGRPRLRPVGPANQTIRGRRPGRPPLTRKTETISSSLTPLTTSQRVFGFYSSPDIDIA